jgi:putative addiction module killer protein
MFVIQQTEEFQRWLDGLKDKKAQARIAARLLQVRSGSLGDWKTVAGPIAEMRVHFGPGYRLYFVRTGSILIIVLAGGDKSSQSRDVKRAQSIWERLEVEP